MSGQPQAEVPDGRPVLVLNAGSSSLKYQLVDVASGAAQAKGSVERIGEPSGEVHHQCGEDRHTARRTVPDHAEALGAVVAAFAEYGPDLDHNGLLAVGHRVVHGGDRFHEPVLVDDDVVRVVQGLTALAPLHIPGNLEGLRVGRERFPGVPQVAVFDTAFHHGLPAHAYTYAVPRSWREEHRVRRYGFHGPSYSYVSRRAAALLDRSAEDTHLVVLHLGNGASAAAVAGGRSVDTSMGLTPLEGLVMGTRSGDLDPGVAALLIRSGLTPDAVDAALNRESGLKGLAGTNDWREVSEAAAGGDADARLAFDVTVYRLRKYVGAYAVVLGRVDALVFTGGIGEHSAPLRAAVCDGLSLLGVELDADANARPGNDERRVSRPTSRVPVLVVPTNEELEIARQAAALVGSR